jgi:hypothetical protein
LIARGITCPVSYLAYVDDATRIVALKKTLYSLSEFFVIVQGYCDLLADLSLVIKMGRNVGKCTLYLYNIPQDAVVPTFTSTVWSYDSQGPANGIIAVVIMRRDSLDRLICYQVSGAILDQAPEHIRAILVTRKYLGVPTDAQLSGTNGRDKILKKLQQRVGLTASKTQNIAEAKISHNMLVCQVATYSPICIAMTLKECMEVDKSLLKAYQYKLGFMPSDAKHSIFISGKLGGLGLCSFTREYVSALIRDIEVYITDEDNMAAHALVASIEAATKQKLWLMEKESTIPDIPHLVQRIRTFQVSEKRILTYDDSFDNPTQEDISCNHPHVMAQAIITTSALGFMLRDLNHELCSRITDELLLSDHAAQTLGCPNITNRRKLGAFIGEGNKRFLRYSIIGHVHLLLQEFMKATNDTIVATSIRQRDILLEDKLSWPPIYRQTALFPKEISPLRIATQARMAIDKFKNDYTIGCFLHLIEWRIARNAVDQPLQLKPQREDYRTIINTENVYRPSLSWSMQENSEKLSQHLYSVLQLKSRAIEDEEIQHIFDPDTCMC